MWNSLRTDARDGLTATCRADRYEASSAPCSAAIRASWTREVMPSFQKMWRRWNATVCVLRNTRFATCRLLSPWATRSVTRRSVSVRLSQPKAGRSAWAQWRSRVPAARRLDRTRARSSASPSSSYRA